MIEDIETLDHDIALSNITTSVEQQWKSENAAALKIQRCFRLRKKQLDFVFRAGKYMMDHVTPFESRFASTMHGDKRE